MLPLSPATSSRRTSMASSCFPAEAAKSGLAISAVPFPLKLSRMVYSQRDSKRRAGTIAVEMLWVAFALRQEAAKSLQVMYVDRQCCVREEATFALVTFSEQPLSRAAA